jgi:hypothetical protein
MVRVLVLAMALAAVGVGALGAARPLAAQTAIDGEYGLRVTDTNGVIGVGWLTEGSKVGVLRVLAGDSVLLDVSTPAAGSHYTTFPRPHTDVELRYGAAGEDPLYSTTLFLEEDRPRETGELSGIDSLFVVGDTHGEFDHLRQLLTNAGLIDADTHWTGGRRHVVFLGDLFDRGSDVTRTLWFLYRLEREARVAGGGAHVVLGNHETMIFTDDLRYVSAKEQLVARLHGVSYQEMFDIRTTVLGRWLAGRPGLMEVDGVLMAHGGVVPELRPHSVAAVNDSLRSFLAEDLFYRWSDSTMALTSDSTLAEAVRDQYDQVIVMDSAAIARRQALVFDENSILWYRGYVQSDTLGAALDRTLENFGADMHVVGHTPVPSVAVRYGGRLVAVDLLDPVTEMLLLTRAPDGERRAWRFRLEGPPEPLDITSGRLRAP